jgi:hypothetical protein
MESSDSEGFEPLEIVPEVASVLYPYSIPAFTKSQESCGRNMSAAILAPPARENLDTF